MGGLFRLSDGGMPQPETCLLHRNPSPVLSVNLQCPCGELLLQAKIRVVGFMHVLCPLYDNF